MANLQSNSCQDSAAPVRAALDPTPRAAGDGTIGSMPARETLRDVWNHHAWADAEHWRAFAASPGALADVALFERLHHLHLTQSAWVWAIGDRRGEFVFTKATDFVPALTLRDVAMRNHASLIAVASASAESELDRVIDIPWFTDPSLRLSVGDGLTQVAMHSHYHRAQNATRFRELGGEPPATDLVTWIWKGRPAPGWVV
ncbi:MAG: hypothetical protein GEU82_02905 [Luteitalea sp.]|nr:hypothetical protein [Luteitalea sp.]